MDGHACQTIPRLDRSGEYERVLNARHDEQPVLGKNASARNAVVS